MKFDNKTALVTGGGSGIGKATALAFARQGARVAVVALHRESAEETVREIKTEGFDAIAVCADVSIDADARRMVKETIRAFGQLDYAVNSAGIGGEVGTTIECSEENWDRVLDTNLKGIWLSMKYEIPEILKQGGGSIVNLSSAHGLRGAAGMPAYAASKGGVIQLTRTAALEFAEQGIRINAICPAHINTPALAKYVGRLSDLDEMGDHLPMKRIGRPEEVAAASEWLCSDAASFVTGHPLSVDAGMTA